MGTCLHEVYACISVNRIAIMYNAMLNKIAKYNMQWITGYIIQKKLYKLYYIATVGNDASTVLSTRIRHLNSLIKQRVDKDIWPPKQTKDFIPLVLIQHQNQRTMQLAIKRAEYYQSDFIHELMSTTSNHSPPSKYCRLEGREPLQKVISSSKVTQEVSEILASLEKDDVPKFILIEGAPGIGKSFLLKEIAYQWSKGVLLQRFKFTVLIILRDPFIKQLSSIEELLLSLCKGDVNAKTTASACSDYLFCNDGRDLVFILDGYDEFPQDL